MACVVRSESGGQAVTICFSGHVTRALLLDDDVEALRIEGIVGAGVIVGLLEVRPDKPERQAVVRDPLWRDLWLVGARVHIATGRPLRLFVHLRPRSPWLSGGPE